MNLLQKVPLHQRPKKSSVGIYIGPDSIEIVQVRRKGKGVFIEKTVSKNISRKDVTGSVIKEIFQQEGIKDTSVTTTIPEEYIMLRRFTMPIIPPQDRPTAIRFEAKRHIPFNIDEVVSSYHIIKEDRIKNEMEILFIAAKKEDIHSTISLLENAGLTVENIEPVVLALIKALNITGILQEQSPPTAILHFLTNSLAQIIVVENGIPYLKREITILNKEKKPEEHLLNEIRLSSSYYKREFPQKDITKLLICGLKTRPTWIEFIKTNLGISVEEVLGFRDTGGIDLPNPQLGIPMGLASRRIEKPRIVLNLLPEELVPARYNIREILAIEITFALCILGLVYLLQIPPFLKLKKAVETAEISKTISPGLELSSRSIDELNTLKTDLQQKKNLLSACTRNRISWGEKLKRLTIQMPQESWITKLTIGDSIGIPGARLLIIAGSTYTPDPTKEIELTNNFSKSLREDPVFMTGFKRLTLGTINKTTIEGHEVANFDISLTVD